MEPVPDIEPEDDAPAMPDVTWAMIIAVVQSTIGMMVAFGLVAWGPEQVESIDAMVIALGPVVTGYGLVQADSRTRVARNERAAVENRGTGLQQIMTGE